VSKILILSNGHGEDLSGSLLGKKLIQMGNQVDALPLVGNGNIYKKYNIKVICKTREFSTGGLGYNTIKGRINDVFNGQIIYIFKKLLLTFLIRNQYQYFLVVGDVVPIIFARFCRKKFFVYLVAYSSHYEGKLKLPWPCRYLLNSHYLQNIYTRDLLTANDLTNQLKRKVFFYGNPFMDVFLYRSKLSSQFSLNIVLLPGSRMPEMINNFCLMIDVLENLSKYRYFEEVEFKFAVVKNFPPEKISNIFSSTKWVLENNNNSKDIFLVMKHKFITVKFTSNSFEDSLYNSDLVISMAGTATEQAVGLNKPIIQIEGKGPQFTKVFAEAQRRLLGESIFCVTNYRNKKEQIKKTASLIIKIMYLIKLDKKFLIACKNNAYQRSGGIISSNGLTDDINYIINQKKTLN